MAKPVILVVDDEPQVLNAVERDLRRRFGGDSSDQTSSGEARTVQERRAAPRRSSG
jgi:hypothetical protein